MKEELTTAMHAEFTITEATERKEQAFAVFEMMTYGYTLIDALSAMRLTLQQVAPYLTQWNELSGKPLTLDQAAYERGTVI